MFLGAIPAASGPMVLVGNEIGLGVIPMGAEVRPLSMPWAAQPGRSGSMCQRVTLMAAGLPLTLKESP
jgi:adenosylcobinamide kinase/adenosylcobinamide-phosphate guanylyltransferase